MTEPSADAAGAASSSSEVEIKFVIVPEGFSHTRKFATSLTLLEMKQQVEADLRIPVASMKLVFMGREMTAPLLSDYEFAKEGQNQVRPRCTIPHVLDDSHPMPRLLADRPSHGCPCAMRCLPKGSAPPPPSCSAPSKCLPLPSPPPLAASIH